MIYYLATGIFIVCILCFAIAMEVHADRKKEEKKYSPDLKDEVYNDLYVIDFYDAIMRADICSGIYKR